MGVIISISVLSSWVTTCSPDQNFFCGGDLGYIMGGPAAKNPKNEPEPEEMKAWVLRSMRLLLEGQVSDTLILSSHKINTVLTQKLGVNLKIDRIGRYLAKFARENKLKRLSTKIPKYEIKRDFLEKVLPDESVKTH
jgi:hypothetical protein